MSSLICAVTENKSSKKKILNTVSGEKMPKMAKI
jgi:hypothetical protein